MRDITYLCVCVGGGGVYKSLGQADVHVLFHSFAKFARILLTLCVSSLMYWYVSASSNNTG
jgi:hypothetical protein